MLKQRLQALENQTVLNLIEGKPLSQHNLQVTLLEEMKNEAEGSQNNASGEEILESYGEF